MKPDPTTIRQTAPEMVRGLLSRAVPFGVGGAGLEDLTDGCAFFSMHDQAGQTVGAFALECLQDSLGTVMHVTAAGGLPGHDLAGDIAAWIEKEAREKVKARAVRCTTRRPALVKRLEREGFKVVGFVVQKEISNGK